MTGIFPVIFFGNDFFMILLLIYSLDLLSFFWIVKKEKKLEWPVIGMNL